MDELENKAKTAPEQLNGIEWKELLIDFPEYADKCDWKK